MSDLSNSIMQDAYRLSVSEVIKHMKLHMLGYFDTVEFIQQQRPPFWSGNYHRRMRWEADIHYWEIERSLGYKEQDVDAVVCFVAGS